MWCFSGNNSELKYQRLCCVISVWNIVNCSLTILFIVLLSGGAVIQSFGASFPVKYTGLSLQLDAQSSHYYRGKFATYTLPDGTGRQQTFRYVCEGPSSFKPVIMSVELPFALEFCF